MNMRRPWLLPLTPVYGAALAMKRRLFQLGWLKQSRLESLLAERSLNGFRKIGGPLNLSMPLNLLGALAMERGDLATAHTLLDESLVIRRELR